MLEPEDILTLMGKEARKVCDTVVPDRPNASTERLTSFIVVSLPYSILNKLIGENDDWWLDMTVTFEIYVADRQSASNPKEFNKDVMKSLRANLKALFPMVDSARRFKITRPKTVIPFVSDGNGYHRSRIQAKMSTMV